MKFLVALAALLVCCFQQSAAQSKFVCYFPNWPFYRTGIGKYTVSNIDPKLCTHLIYAFATLNATTYTINVADVWVDIDNQFYAKFNALRQINPALKTMIAIGGGTDSQGTKYSQLVADPTKINNFVTSVVNFLRQYGFNGLDVDWEYPSTAADKTGFSNLLKALRSAFNQNGFLLSVAVGAGQSTIDAGYDVPVISQNVDFINLMTYDMHGSWEAKADHHAPMYKRFWETVNFNVDFTVNYWITKGASPSKLVVGIPLYGRSWKLSSIFVVPPAAASGPGTQGPQTGEAGFLAYYEICNNIRLNGWKVVTDPLSVIGPYAFSSTEWVGYDDVNMSAFKARYAVSKGLGGAMVWDITMDDFTNVCGGGINPIMTAISKNLNSSSVVTSSTTAKPTTVTTRAAVTTTKAPTTVITTKASISSTATKPTTATTKAPSTIVTTKASTSSTATKPATATTKAPTTTVTTKASTSSTTTKATTTSTTNKSTTKAPATTTTKATLTTTKSSSVFTCPTSSGFYANPTSCSSYYVCIFGQAVLMQCVSGLYFNPATGTCDWPQNVACSTGK